MKQAWKDFEEYIAHCLEGRMPKGSGNQWHAQGDGSNATYKWSCKLTDAKSYSLKLADLNEIHTQALREGKLPAMFVDINGFTFAVIPFPDFMELIDKSP